MKLWIGLSVFAAYATLDALYAIYTEALVAHRAHRAAFTAVFIYALSAYGVRSYMSDPIYMLPLVLGAWSGTYITVTILKRRAYYRGKAQA